MTAQHGSPVTNSSTLLENSSEYSDEASLYITTRDDEVALNLHKEDFTVFACLGDLLDELEQRGYPAGERKLVPELRETAAILSQVHELGQFKAVNSQATAVAHPEREILTELEKLADICHPVSYLPEQACSSQLNSRQSAD